MGCHIPAAPTRAEELAWAAGLFEGEGCFSVRSAKYPYPTAQLTSTDQDVIDDFARIIGIPGSNLARRDPRNAGYKPSFRWTLMGTTSIKELRDLIGPWMRSRRKTRLDEVIQLAEDAGITSRRAYKG